MGKKQTFTREFKLSVLQELETKSVAEVCRMHNLASSTLCTWKKRYNKKPSSHIKLAKEHIIELFKQAKALYS